VICVDASVALKWLFPEDYSTEALTLAADSVHADEPVIAPPLLLAEVTNNVYQRARRSELTVEGATETLARFLEFPVEVVSPDRLDQLALRVALSYRLSAAYDAYYIALSEMTGATLWTDDRRLLRDLDGRLAFVKALSGYGEGEAQ
jgi:predicted nucleic acid-binding protein